MTNPISVRLDPEAERVLRRLARTTGRTRSEIVRQALVVLERSTSEAGRDATPYEVLADLIGSVHGGPTDLSARTGERFVRLLEQRKHSRASTSNARR